MRNWFRNRLLSRPETACGVHEPVATELPPMPSERSTGYVFAAVAAIIALLYRNDTTLLIAALTTASAFAGVATVVPHWLAPLNRAWFALALLLNRVVSPVVMGVLFAGLIVPAGLVMQLRRDPLRAKRNRNTASYWIDRQPAARPASMRDQF